MEHIARFVVAVGLAPLVVSCSAFWPAVTPRDPKAPVFHTSAPARWVADLDPALCSLATVGPEVTRLIHPPPKLPPHSSAEDWCAGEPQPPNKPSPCRSAMVGQLVSVSFAQGSADGYLYRIPNATGIVVVFAGLGMPPDGWINQRFAGEASRRGFATFAIVRVETRRPMRFDPLAEAHRGILAAKSLRGRCGIAGNARVAFLGISMGGMEALLAARDVAVVAPELHGAPASVLDPLLSPEDAADNFDSFWHGVSVDAMQTYFRRLLVGRYGAPKCGVRFGDLLSPAPGIRTNLKKDAPARWLCGQSVGERFHVFLSATDPVLGDDQRERLEECGFPTVAVRSPGHTPLACELSLFERMVTAIDQNPIVVAQQPRSGD